MTTVRTLDVIRQDFASGPMIAMPIAGTLAWTAAGLAALVVPAGSQHWPLFIATGSTFGLGVAISRLTGENILGKDQKKNELDSLFIYCVMMSNLVWAIAIPFFWVRPDSLPLSLGILAGLMWLPMSWMMQHWVGTFHAVSRTLLVLATWWALPDYRFVAVPAAVVLIYLISIVILVTRTRPAPVPLEAAAGSNA